MTSEPKNFEPAAPGNRHLTAEALGLAEAPKDAATPKPDEPTDASEPVLTDEEFAELDTDGDGVVHLAVEEMKGNYTRPEEPPEPEQQAEAKDRKSAPENKDAAALRDDKSEGPKPIGAGMTPGRKK